MQIKKQTYLLFIGMIFLAIFCALSVPVFFHLRSYQTYHMRGYKESKKTNETLLSQKSWKSLESYIRQIPKDMQVTVIYDDGIIFSTFPELEDIKTITPEQFFKFIENTFDYYDYQIQSFFIIHDELFINEHFGMEDSFFNGRKRNKGYVACRYDITKRNKKNPNFKISWTIFLSMSVIELLTGIFFVMFLQRISNSVLRLKNATEKIINGDMDTPIDTAKRHSEAEEISSLTKNLEQMRISLKDAKDRRTRFIMGISHDLRTPVALIKGYSEAIADGIISGNEIEKSSQLINSNAIRLEGMINDLINYVKLNQKDWMNKLEDTALLPVINEIASNMKLGSEVNNRIFELNMNIPEDTKLRLDKNLFTRALENLFSNALRYTSDGDTITLSTWIDKSGMVKISVKDTGSGIAKKDQEKVFELFYRGTNSRREKGMGIGLAVVKTIIETHGWYIDIKSEQGKGTEFIITAG